LVIGGKRLVSRRKLKRGDKKETEKKVWGGPNKAQKTSGKSRDKKETRRKLTRGGVSESKKISRRRGKVNREQVEFQKFEKRKG